MNRAFLLDLVERTLATYVQALLGLLTADSTGLLSLGAVRASAVAALPAAYAVVKGALAGSVGTSGTASLVPPTTTVLPLLATGGTDTTPQASPASATTTAPVAVPAQVVQTVPADPAVTG